MSDSFTEAESWAGALALFVAAALMVGCSADLKHATCGWSTNIPSNGDLLCRQTYKVLAEIAEAEIHGTNAVIRSHVSSPTVAGRMIAFGQRIRRHHVRFLRVTPSFELSALSHGRLQVGAYLVGQTDQGKVDDPETLVERAVHSTVVVTGDAPGQEW
jgi:hypothetical protein